ncbi:MAG: ThiF family adenylyltransferase [Pyrinomonadaceae bacterium]|nr:ThiF family adenylyltransferase [Pyrinomonadaceae bacterium]
MYPPNADEFYRELTLRNRGLISDEDQQRLRGARILVAGCGSTGGAAIEPLVRAGAENLVLVEPGAYELNNLNRQRASVEALGRNKARWLGERASAINPHLNIEVHTEGVTAENARAICNGCALVIDAVDVTTMQGLAAKFALHEAAQQSALPTISAYDLAFRQYVRVYDYREGHLPFDDRIGRLRRARNPVEALAILVPVWAIPADLLDEIERLMSDPGASISQLGCTADLFGALVVPLALELLARRRVRKSFVVDLKDAISPRRMRLRRRVLALAGLLRVQRRVWSSKG